MRSKGKPAQTDLEAAHVAKVAALSCVVCEATPVHVHEPEQGMWWISIALCPACHTGSDGWHGTRKRWTLARMTELKAINRTLERVARL